MPAVRVNFTDVEVRDFEPVPAGKYHVKITDFEWREASENAKNPGQEYLSFEFTIQDGQYTDRKLWANAMVYNPNALFTLKGILKACGYNADGELEFDPEDLVGKDLIVRAVKQGERTLDNGQTVGERNEVKGYYPYDGEVVTASANNSLLP